MKFKLWTQKDKIRGKALKVIFSIFIVFNAFKTELHAMNEIEI